MSYIHKISMRYLKGQHKLIFSYSNLLSLLGIIIGVFSLLVVSSVMNGFSSDMRTRVIGSKAEIRIYNQDFSPIQDYNQVIEQLSNIPEVLGIAAICENELILQKGQKIVGTVSNGVDFDEYRKIAKVLDNIVVGYPEAKDLEEDGIILGLGMSLDLQATVGEYVTLSSPVGTIPTPLGIMPLSKKLKVVGILRSDLPEFNSIYSFISLENGKKFLAQGAAVSRIDISTSNPDKSKKSTQKIQKLLGSSYLVEDWSDFEANLFNAMKLEKAVMFFVLGLMLVIASFNMIGNFIKLVTEKRSEIGILKALGASEQDIRKIFIYAGVYLGLLGTIIGFVLAITILLIQKFYPFISIPVPGFPLVWIPVELDPMTFILVPILVIIISWLTTLYPAQKTLKIDTIKIIRNQE